MALLSRIYFNAVFGALGGLLGWMLFGIFGNRTSDELNMQALLGGFFIGGSIGFLVVSVEAIRDRSVLRVSRLATYGVVLGSVGGAVGMLLGDLINYWIVGKLDDPKSFLGITGAMFARGLGWMFLGLAIGISEGIASRSLGKLSYGTLGGAIGGFIGGALFGLAYLLTRDSTSAAAALWGAIGLIILGASIGALSALVQGVFQPASVRVMRGWQEGREYPLDKEATLLGREEHADIALFRDMKVEKRHAYIRREGERYLLVNNQAPPQFTLVNGQPVHTSRDLQDGDRIQLGNVVLRFQARSAKNNLPQRGAPRMATVVPS